MFHCLILSLFLVCCSCQTDRRSRLDPKKIFPDSIWRRNVTLYPVNPQTDYQIRAVVNALAGANVGTRDSIPLFPGFISIIVGINTPVTPPIYTSNKNATVEIETELGEKVFLPDVVVTPSGGEFGIASPNLVVIVRNGVEYDIGGAVTFSVDGVNLGGGFPGPLQGAQTVVPFNLSGTGTLADSLLAASRPSSTSQSGTALLAGMLLPEDIEQGSIDHVIGVS